MLPIQHGRCDGFSFRKLLSLSQSCRKHVADSLPLLLRSLRFIPSWLRMDYGPVLLWRNRRLCIQDISIWIFPLSPSYQSSTFFPLCRVAKPSCIQPVYLTPLSTLQCSHALLLLCILCIDMYACVYNMKVVQVRILANNIIYVWTNYDEQPCIPPEK